MLCQAAGMYVASDACMQVWIILWILHLSSMFLPLHTSCAHALGSAAVCAYGPEGIAVYAFKAYNAATVL